ncbi:MAG: GAF domain-containing protein [Desulfobacterales bacterium]|nr:MAG: GAF domain-containing protein [Desulfobacterales bacterium]
MNLDKWPGRGFLQKKNLYYKLNIIFGLFFLFPVAGFIFFSIRYDMLNDQYVPLFFLGVLIFSLVGFTILKNLIDKIVRLSTKLSKNYITELTGDVVPNGTDELHNIVRSFTAIEKQFSNTFRQLEKKTSEISILKELSDLCYVTFDPEEILYITLERALMLTDSDVGSILVLDVTEPKSFTVKATVGLSEVIKIGDRIDFESSIAKYAVINKSPLVIKDIEADSRFGRANLTHYGTKSFICMPIKTSNEIIGVLTISRKENDKVYSPEDVEALTPLLSNAAFTFENLRLLRMNEKRVRYLRFIEKIFKILNSSFKDHELLHAVLNEIQSIVPFMHAFVMTREETQPEYFKVFELLFNDPANIAKGARYPFRDTIIEKALKQETILIVDDTSPLTHAVDQELFVHQGCTSYLLAPLKTEGRISALLVFGAVKPDLFFEAQDLIKWIANGLSMAIERNRLSAVVVKRDQELDTIRQIGSALASSTFDISKVLQYTLEMIQEVMNVEAGSLLLMENNQLELAVAFNTKLKSMKKFRLKMGQGIAGYVAARGESIIVNNTGKSSHYFPVVDEVTGFKTRSALCVPMISQGKVIGVIEVLNKIYGDFDENDKALLQSIALSVSIALENARLYKETVSMAEHERDVRHMFQKFVPKEVLDQIIHGSATGKPVIEELRTITLLNIDIRGFSALARKIGSQKTVSLLNSFFAVMGDIVFKHHGIIDKYLGDGFLALFGAPVSNTRDADNAVAAALEMQKSIVVLNKYLEKKMDVSVCMGISVHTGEVVVGNIGFEKKMDYTVIGDSVNTVFRLQSLTKSIPDRILISEYTLRAARSRLQVGEFEAAAEIAQNLNQMKVFELIGQELDQPLAEEQNQPPLHGAPHAIWTEN